MQTARCTFDNSLPTSAQFQAWPPTKQTMLHDSLSCPACNEPAYFRQETRNGRAPCFCAHHAPGCPFTTALSTVKGQKDGGQGSAYGFQQPRIVVDFFYGTPTTQALDSHGVSFSQMEEHQRCSAGDGAGYHGAVIYRRLSSLLRELVSTPTFGVSNQILNVDRQTEATAAQLFVRFDRITDQHIGRYHGYWGDLNCVKQGSSGELWLNSGLPGDFSICVPTNLVPSLRERFKWLSTAHRGTGVQVLVFGVLHKAAWMHKPFIEVADLSMMTMHDPAWG